MLTVILGQVYGPATLLPKTYVPVTSCRAQNIQETAKSKKNWHIIKEYIGGGMEIQPNQGKLPGHFTEASMRAKLRAIATVFQKSNVKPCN